MSSVTDSVPTALLRYAGELYVLLPVETCPTCAQNLPFGHRCTSFSEANPSE